MRRGNWEYLVMGLAVGFSFGVVTGILFAPTSGDRTRRRLAEQARIAGDMARRAAERAEDAAGAVHQRVDHYLGREEEVAWRKVRELREGVDRYTRSQPES